MACWAYLDLPRNTVSDKVIRDKSFAIASNPQYDRYQRSLASKFDKKPKGNVVLAVTNAKSEFKPINN